MATPSIFSELINFDRFREIALHFVREQNADVLLTSPGFGHCGRSFIGILPDEEFILTDELIVETLEHEVKAFAFSDSKPSIGYVSYDCGQVLRSVKTIKHTQYPFVHLKKYKAVLVHDEVDGSVKCLCDDNSFIAFITEQALSAGQITDIELPGFSDHAVTMSLDKKGYEDGVRKTLEHIRDGLTYQLNLSTMFRIKDVDIDPVLWFFTLNKKFPAPYYAMFKSSEDLIISTSPELFLRVENGHVLSEPIKGTLHFEEYSAELEKELTSSPKEDAELSMIVDLVRNDISSDCKYGSVKVEDHKSVFAVDNLLQMFSRVRGELAEGRDCLDLFFNAFPGGSITGCPKKSSMELIEKLEPHSRGPFCGSIVLIEGSQNMISSIAIRTAVYNLKDKNLTYWAGSGIVIDSDPEDEYLETLAKAGKILHPQKHISEDS
ncbi:anthranilate synthase component I family protein [Desulfovibrio gilichinskyi]|uniref:Para-aminobenzoate synthetase component 1 n=1 Tax=Desulfovibrio gilichinskyi TaxID=1519643 RepID=A0A1X7D1A1_9BACT|nr:anthranilate synthase component I family protein [Desulfovibrio gilichinskyi]SMF06808.1 para-aminobenzoate synthetase component 1 [Desulfovibrio gilichinskyi]